MTQTRIELYTDRFRLHGLHPEDATDRIGEWLSDPDVAGPLNVAPTMVPVAQLRKEFGSANGKSVFVVGIRPKGGEPLIGYYRINADPVHRTATFNVVIGERDWWGKGVVLETRAALLTEMFENRGIEKAVGQPPARNFASVHNYQSQGWTCEGVLHKHAKDVSGDGRIDQVQFGMLASDWAKQQRGAA